MRGVESVLWLCFLLCAAYVGRVSYAMLAAREAAQAVLAAPSSGPKGPIEASSDAERMGTLEIPALNLKVPFYEGIDGPSLLRGLGHVPSTALPGGLGTMALAGHRDTYLRSLAGVTPKMEIHVVGAGGLYRYRVDSTEIVSPDAVRVLEIVQEPSLVLITCYPFHYVGAAPQRFIVHAHLESVLPG